MKDVAAVILAAGKGERMRSDLPKVMHQVAGKPMVFYPVAACKDLGLTKIVVIIGHGKETVMEGIKDSGVAFSEQTSQLGTAHAVVSAEEHLKNWKGKVLILSGDVPLITKETIQQFIAGHDEAKNDITFLTTTVENPTGYGRVVRTAQGGVEKIVEEKDASSAERAVKEINAGIYCVASSLLFDLVKGVALSHKGEYYLTDIVQKGIDAGLKVSATCLDECSEVMGVNNKVELSRANEVLRMRILNNLMLEGVNIRDPNNTYIDYGVAVGSETTVYPNVFIEGESVVGDRCVIEEGCKIINSHVGAGSTIKSSTVIEDSRIGKKVVAGPFARLRPGTVLGDEVKIGNFVEVKNSKINNCSKANHLSYLGDSIIGERVNIGAGTITCNYDGIKKHRTIIEDNAFIGSDAQLIAPVRIGKGAYVGSGATITKDVPPGALAISRVDQRNIEGWVERKRKKIKGEEE
jgi:bifunctional UDP-N-acetylglucosamine pyrophosphorylase/glucosamine-1-phosphate N-acetyltransferase